MGAIDDACLLRNLGRRFDLIRGNLCTRESEQEFFSSVNSVPLHSQQSPTTSISMGLKYLEET